MAKQNEENKGAVQTVVESVLVTLASICAELGALTVDTRGKLAAIGGKIMAYGKSKGHETVKALKDGIETEAKLQGLKLDMAYVSKAIKAHADRKLANEKGVYKQWSEALTDSEAQEILDTACGKQKKAKTEKSDLQKAIAAFDKLDANARFLMLSHICTGLDMDGVNGVASMLEQRLMASTKENTGKASTPSTKAA